MDLFFLNWDVFKQMLNEIKEKKQKIQIDQNEEKTIQENLELFQNSVTSIYQKELEKAKENNEDLAQQIYQITLRKWNGFILKMNRKFIDLYIEFSQKRETYFNNYCDCYFDKLQQEIQEIQQMFEENQLEEYQHKNLEQNEQLKQLQKQNEKQILRQNAKNLFRDCIFNGKKKNKINSIQE